MQDIYARAEAMIGMSDAVWLRHANPWSLATRVPILPAIAAVLWARDWLGWGTLAALLALVVWAWVNPRAFPPPQRRDSWAAQGTFGERVFLHRAAMSIPDHHRRWAHGLTVVSALGVVPLGWGLWVYDAGWVVAGLALCLGAKLWFVDRMVWLYRDMAPVHPEYAAWAEAEGG